MLFRLSKYEVPLLELEAFAFVFGVNLKGLLLAWLLEKLSCSVVVFNCAPMSPAENAKGCNEAFEQQICLLL